MQIETYEIEEIKGSDASTMAADGAAIELIEKLGLKGQQTLVDPKTATRSPFRVMTILEQTVFKTLFPEKMKVQDFNTEIIPVRVLEVLDRAMQDQRFAKFEIWHSRTRRDDPVLVGLAGKLKSEKWGEYVEGEVLFLLARWGDALDPFDKLTEIAKRAWLAARRRTLTGTIADAKAQLESSEADAEHFFSVAARTTPPII